VVTTFGILSLAFGGLGLLSIPMTLASLYWFEALTHVRNPLLDVMDADPLVRSWMFASLALGAAAAVCLATAGAGLLAMAEWARRLAVLWAGFSLAFGVLGIVMNVAVVSPALLRLATLLPTPGPAKNGAIAGAVGGSIGGIVGLVYPALLLYFITRSEVRAAFASATAGRSGVSAAARR
jgi:hypothetical protein